MSLPISLSFL